VTRCTALVAAAVVLVGVGCSDDGEAAKSTAATVTTVAAGQPLDRLVPGDCLVDEPDASSGRVETVDCELAHRAEVYGVADLDGGPFPGTDQLNVEAALRCDALHEGYAGEPVDPTTDRAFAEIVPSEASWAEDDRHVVCLALPPAGASAEGSIAAASASASP